VIGPALSCVKELAGLVGIWHNGYMLNIEKLSNTLIEKHQPDLILLYGSFARGDYTPKSDIDVVCFKDIEEATTDNRDFGGLYLDCWIRPLSDLENIEGLVYLNNSKVLYDPNERSEDLFEKINLVLSEPPKALTKVETEHIKSWVLKMLDRTYRGDIEANYRRVWLVYELLAIHYKLSRLRFPGSKLAFIDLKQNKPKLYKSFDKALKNPADSILVKKLVYKVLGM